MLQSYISHSSNSFQVLSFVKNGVWLGMECVVSEVNWEEVKY